VTALNLEHIKARLDRAMVHLQEARKGKPNMDAILDDMDWLHCAAWYTWAHTCKVFRSPVRDYPGGRDLCRDIWHAKPPTE
jgi:hypothetical protein